MATKRKPAKKRPSKLAFKRRANALPKKRTASAGKSLAACRVSVRNGAGWLNPTKWFVTIHAQPQVGGRGVWRQLDRREHEDAIKGNPAVRAKVAAAKKDGIERRFVSRGMQYIVMPSPDLR